MSKSNNDHLWSMDQMHSTMCTQMCKYIVSFNPYDNFARQIILLFPFYRYEHNYLFL